METLNQSIVTTPLLIEPFIDSLMIETLDNFSIQNNFTVKIFFLIYNMWVMY